MEQTLPPSTEYSAYVLEDSLSFDGKRLTTMVVTFPRIVLSEFNTHRALSKNSASSRARPPMKVVREVIDNPFLPTVVGRNKSGMQATEYFDEHTLGAFHEQLLVQRDRAVIGFFENVLSRDLVNKVLGPSNVTHYLSNGVGEDWVKLFPVLEQFYKELLKASKQDNTVHSETFFNPHKQTVNRYLEPFMWHTVIVSGTEWGNYFGLRDDKENAAPEIYEIAHRMREAMDEAAPLALSDSMWHTPFLTEEEKTLAIDNPHYWLGVSVGRCARVSYVNHFGERNPDADYQLAQSLLTNGHMSPFEHIATPTSKDRVLGNFTGWMQLRKLITFESDFSQRGVNSDVTLESIVF